MSAHMYMFSILLCLAWASWYHCKLLALPYLFPQFIPLTGRESISETHLSYIISSSSSSFTIFAIWFLTFLYNSHLCNCSACFSALGVLVCFGGASLTLAGPTGISLRSRKKSSSLSNMPYPKTLADLLVAEKIRGEQLAIAASEEAEV